MSTDRPSEVRSGEVGERCWPMRWCFPTHQGKKQACVRDGSSLMSHRDSALPDYQRNSVSLPLPPQSLQASGSSPVLQHMHSSYSTSDQPPTPIPTTLYLQTPLNCRICPHSSKRAAPDLHCALMLTRAGLRSRPVVGAHIGTVPIVGWLCGRAG